MSTVPDPRRAEKHMLTMSLQEYLGGRLDQYQSWYDRKVVRMKAWHFRMRTVAVLGGVAVPVLVNVEYRYAKLVASILSLVVASVVALGSLYRYRDQWRNYRSTEQMIGHERIHFETRIGRYVDLGDDAAFQQLVERVEDLIASENAATLDAMTHGAATTPDDHHPTRVS